MKILGIIGCILLLPMSVIAEESFPESEEDNYTFKPVLLDGSDNSSAVLGVRYGFDKKWIFLEYTPPISDEGTDSWGNGAGTAAKLTEKNGYVEVKLAGLWTSDKELNPESFSKFNLDIGYEISLKDDVNTNKNEGKDIDFGLQVAVEGDQNYDNSQTVTALQAGFLLGDASKSFVSGILSYGEIDASEDDGRKAVTSIEKFDRASAEIHIQYPLASKEGRKYSPKAISFNYRYYGEIDPPDAIKAADLDVFQWSVVRLKFEKGIYVAYSEGKLPFDAKSDSVLEVGLSHNLF